MILSGFVWSELLCHLICANLAAKGKLKDPGPSKAEGGNSRTLLIDREVYKFEKTYLHK